MVDQQPRPSRQLMFALSPTKTFNLRSVASRQIEDSQHNTSGLSGLFRSIPSLLKYQQINTPQPFLPSQLQPAPSPVPTTPQQEQARPLSQSSQQSQPKSADLACLKSLSGLLTPKKPFSGPPKSSKSNYHLCCSPKTKKYTAQHLTHPQTHKKLSE